MSEAVTQAATTVAEKPAEPTKTAEEKLHERADVLIAAHEAAKAAPPKPVEATVEMDAATLQKLTEASERARSATKRADDEKRKREEIEASTADVASMREAQKLWKEGKRVEAIQKLSAVEDPSGDIEDLLQKWVAAPAKPGEQKLTPDEIKALQDEAAEGKKFRETEQAKAKAETDRKNAHAFSMQLRDAKAEDGAARYPLASAPENAESAAVVAVEKATAKLLKLGSPTVTRELAEHLFELAYAEIEANLAKAKPAVVVPPTEVTRPAVRAAVVPRAGTTPAGKKAYARTPEGARERLLDNARAAVEASGGKWA